ncbi:SidA/IucD/PvdA family monooxygenase [Chitinophaga pendula]|uniref:lysine N(6)-hydroxylase/L-ornithine N(5)-oxygenase family protein n=1 Tax=Chitinophaga TaxID=79328 RepID=UPI000BAFE399|nr:MULTISPECIES: SidA/IucD/PvdA family monooxygenase [Chitinophaga]ASZ12319.1 alcaligin biosynthesis protein [Chitinophaga sp. MD30]UCJ10088.1 SidA/IucD/PvdA family monooxygenase [Chitinophaga pendula]
MDTKQVYTIIGIGIGPFNLGLAALLQPVKEISALFFDKTDEFNWHAGLMLNNTTLQDPFMGTDLVTMADPTSEYSFLNFLKQTGRLYRFFIRHDFYMLRREYNVYCQWVARQLNSCRFSHEVTAVNYNDGLYEIAVLNKRSRETTTYYAEKIVLGTGTQPSLPGFVNKADMPGLIHSSEYLTHKEGILRKGELTIVGSGQSAAEIFYDLLPETQSGFRLNWFTRSDRFFPMEHSKLTLEISSHNYVEYFYNLAPQQRAKILKTQASLSKGINYSLIDQIYDMLYEMTVGGERVNVLLRANCELRAITAAMEAERYTLDFMHVQQQQEFTHEAGPLLLATGYRYNEPVCLSGIAHRIDRNEDGSFNTHRNYTIDVNHNEIFIQNAETQTHGFTAPDLSLGAYRNSWIINALSGREIYKLEKEVAYQHFGNAAVALESVTY